MSTFAQLVDEFAKNYQAIEDEFNAKWHMSKQSTLYEIYQTADDEISGALISYEQDDDYVSIDFLNDIFDVLDYFRRNIDMVLSEQGKVLINSLYDVTREFYFEAFKLIFPQSLL